MNNVCAPIIIIGPVLGLLAGHIMLQAVDDKMNQTETFHTVSSSMYTARIIVVDHSYIIFFCIIYGFFLNLIILYMLSHFIEESFQPHFANGLELEGSLDDGITFGVIGGV